VYIIDFKKKFHHHFIYYFCTTIFLKCEWFATVIVKDVSYFKKRKIEGRVKELLICGSRKLGGTVLNYPARFII